MRFLEHPGDPQASGSSPCGKACLKAPSGVVLIGCFQLLDSHEAYHDSIFCFSSKLRPIIITKRYILNTLESRLAQMTTISELEKDTERTSRWLTALCWIILLIGGPYYAFTIANSDGYIRHSKITPVLLSGNWMVGEYRECDVWWIGSGGTIGALRCATDKFYTDEQEHDLPVHYWGRIVRADFIGKHPDDGGISIEWRWRCQRGTDDIVCWAEN